MKRFLLSRKYSPVLHGVVVCSFVVLVLAVALGLWGLAPTQASAASSDTKMYTTAAQARTAYADAIIAASPVSGMSMSASGYSRSVSLKWEGSSVGSVSGEAYVISPSGGANNIIGVVASFDLTAYKDKYTNFVVEGANLKSYGMSTDGYYNFSFTCSPTNIMGIHSAWNYSITCDRKPVPLPADPTKEGHHFVGWYYDEALTQAYDGSPIYEDTTLYAKFEINRYTITYNTEGGEALAPVTVEWNKAAPMPTPTRTGYNFVGWYTTDGVAYNGEAITANTTLVAHWDIKVFTVTFYADGEEYTSLQVIYGTSLVEAMEQAHIASYGVKDSAGVRISKMSTITEDTHVLVHELTTKERLGDYIGTHTWVLWVTVGIIAALVLTAGISIAVAVKRK